MSDPARSDASTTHAAGDAETADALLDRAKRLRAEGDSGGALALYGRVARESQEQVAIATAAAGLARLGARDEAWEAIERVLSSRKRPPLATARAGEAAAVLGDLVRARACAGEVVEGTDTPSTALRNAIRVLEQAGEPRSALRVARRVGDEAGVARIEGTLGSYDPSWLPTMSGVRASFSPQPGRSLALLETSLPYVRSGYTYRAQTLLRAQRQAGLEPIALTRLGFPVTRGLSAPPREEVDGVVHHRADLPGIRQYTSVPVTGQLDENVRWAARVAREHRPEGIVAATPHLNGLVGLALRRELGIPLIYDVRGFPEMTWAVRRGGGDTDAFGLRRVAETRCMREADLVVTLSETMRRHIIGRGVAADRVHVLPHAVDTAAFAPRRRDGELAVSLGLGARPVVGYISSLVPYEGVETLVEAIALARRSNPEIAGVIVGDGELLPSLEAQATRLGLDGHVVFTGRVEASEVMRYYSLTDVFVCPRQDHEVTRYVTPLKPFEAMAAGSCIAVSDLPTLREAVRDGECGALFAAGDAAILARTIVDLVERPERRRALADAAREHVLANHGLDTLCSRFAEVWAELRERSEAAAA
jgi:glycosyltransferase involved in cell wall biosynthesis